LIGNELKNPAAEITFNNELASLFVPVTTLALFLD
jgi:hypothetical protein